MALPQPVNIDIPRGKDFLYVIEVTEDNDGLIPMDLSGLSVSSHIRVKDTGPLLAAFVIDMTEADVGILSLTLDAAETALLTATSYRYDVFINDDDDMLARGAVTMVGPITHA